MGCMEGLRITALERIFEPFFFVSLLGGTFFLSWLSAAQMIP